MCMIFNLCPLCQFLVFQAREKKAEKEGEEEKLCLFRFNPASSTLLSLSPGILSGTTGKTPFSEKKLSSVLFVAELSEGLITYSIPTSDTSGEFTFYLDSVSI